jgi:SAM-dependent methyltransferase
MQDLPILTDRTALLRNRARAVAMEKPAVFLHEEAALDLQDRLNLVNRTFTSPAVVTGFPDLWRALVPGAKMVADEDILDLEIGAHDLVVHAMALHWANDPVGQLAQARRALKPDGLLLAVFFGGNTLTELRNALAQSEAAATGGLAPRVAPMGELRDLGGLLQRAGFALPVADLVPLTVTYDTAFDLMRDLRSMGEGNALADRDRRGLRREVLTDAAAQYHDSHAVDGRIPATFDLVVLTGWAPADSQPQPLRPGSATTRLADAIGSVETPLSGGDD